MIGWCGVTFGQSSVLQSGTWYKIAVAENGVYKIDLATFKKMGFSSNSDPRKIKIYGNAGGMLPQANNIARPSDLVENSIHIPGEADGVFNSSDYILFYAQGPDKTYFDASKEIFHYEKNLYDDKNYYFITVGESNGKRITTAPDPGGATLVKDFENFVYYELDEYSELKSGRDWYGERFDATTELTKSFTLENITPGSTIKFVSDVMAKSSSGSSFKVFFNGVEIATQSIGSIPTSQYGLKGKDRRDTLVFNANTVSASGQSNQEIKYQYIKNPSGIGFLDYFLFQVNQKLALYGDQTIFRSLSSLENPISKYELEQSSAQTVIWDITDPYEPESQSIFFSSGKISFSAPSSTLKEFIAFASTLSPELVGVVSNQSIRSLSVPNFVIVTHPDLKEEALRLAAHRNTEDGVSTQVVTTTEIYNEFSSGRQDVSAIRDFVKSLYDRSPSTLKSLLLFGKGSYDYKNHVVDNVNLVPIYESRNSLHPLNTYSSDDYYTFLENDEGYWEEEFPYSNDDMDISVGRIPAKSATEARDVVNKIIQYSTDATLFGKWRKEIVFVADDGDPTYSHQGDANDLAQLVEVNHGQFDARKIFLDMYTQESNPGGEISVETNKLIEESFNRGALVINYNGHGGERLWAQEKIFDDLMISRLENKRLPLLVTATCEFGRQDDPILISGAELCLLRPGGGAIGLVTTSRPVNASTNFILNEAFYNAFFQKENNQTLTLGEIFRRTKNNSISGVSNRNFSLIGDPSLHLAIPRDSMIVTEIQTASGSSTLMALSRVTVKGIVADPVGDTISNFNGIVEAVLFDKETSFTTLGDENQPYSYNQWFNALFRGRATVKDGVFEFQFVVPKNIAYQVDKGKLSLYAYDTLNETQASGYSQDFDIGSSEPNPDPDSTSPLLNLFMGDTTFVNGGITNPNTKLVARLFDANGINISGYGIGNSLIAILDESETFILNDYYEADIDNFTRGTITFPFTNLLPGKHTITVKAWDTYNNPVQSTINFIVTDGTNLIIETFGNYPNPFETSTTLFFTHNRSGDDLQVSLIIYDYTGNTIESFEVEVPTSPYLVEVLKLNRDTSKIRTGGLYFARMLVRSLANGSKNEQVTKLIILN